MLLRCPAPKGHYHGHGWNYHRGEVPGWEQTGLSVFEPGTGEGGYGWIIPHDSSWLPGAGFFAERLGTTVLRSESLAQDLPATLYILLHLVTAGHEVYVFFARELPRNLPRGSAEALVLVGYAGAASREDLDVLIPFSSAAPTSSGQNSLVSMKFVHGKQLALHPVA